MKIAKLLSCFILMINKPVSCLKINKQPYWFNPKIHNFGNIGIGGKIHAKTASFFTKMIDILAYNNTDIRKELLVENIPISYRVCDLGCGVGLSTHIGEYSIGIDTSSDMIDVAKEKFPNKKFSVGNAESFGENKYYDFVTISFLFHEVPFEGREKILKNALRISKLGVIVMDISPDYVPSKQMLTGEPYILEYCKNISKQIKGLKYKTENIEIAPGRANIWIISKLKNSFLYNYKKHAFKSIKNY